MQNIFNRLNTKHGHGKIINIIALPLFLFIILVLLKYLYVNYLLSHYQVKINYIYIIDIAFQAAFIFNIFWLIIRSLKKAYSLINEKYFNHINPIYRTIIPYIIKSLKFSCLFILFYISINLIHLRDPYYYISNKIISISFILLITWNLLKIINITQDYIIIKYDIDNPEKALSSKAKTQILIIKRIIDFFVVLFSIGLIFMVFDNIKELGASLLASAGIAGIVFGFAAQKSLNSFILGLQIAINQPIKINDYVIVENEFGQIEEITLMYVIVKLWDLRRIIVPINYFVENTFQNWSVKTTNLLGSIFLYTDYTLPIENVRNELANIITQSSYWDKKFYNLQVSDSKEETMEIRILVSSSNPPDLWDLRCEVREKILRYIASNYPNSLPKKRFYQN
jgi:small-conductance mechanosensitive channel